MADRTPVTICRERHSFTKIAMYRVRVVETETIRIEKFKAIIVFTFLPVSGLEANGIRVVKLPTRKLATTRLSVILNFHFLYFAGKYTATNLTTAMDRQRNKYINKQSMLREIHAKVIEQALNSKKLP